MTRPLLALAIAAVAAAGCGIGSRAVEYSDPRTDAAAKTFSVTPGKANIYVYRDQVYLGDAPLEVVLDERWSAKLVGQTYFSVEVDTGMHRLRAKGEKETTLDVLVPAGANVLVRVEVSPSVLTLKATMYLMQEDEGRTGVAGCRRVDAFE
jgi:hypothetical protein